MPTWVWPLKKTKVPNYVWFNYRRVPALSLAQELITQGRLGKIYHVRAVYLQDWIMDPNFPLVWRLKKSKESRTAVPFPKSRIPDFTEFLKCPEEVKPSPGIPKILPRPLSLRKKTQRVEEVRHYEKGIGYLELKMFEKAEQEFKEQLRLLPKHVPSLLGLANLYADTGRDSEADAACQSAIKADNLQPAPHFILGLMAFKKEDFSSAAVCFKKTLYCDEGHFLARFYLALTNKSLGNTEAAHREFSTTISTIKNSGSEGLREEIAGNSASYILSLCEDYLPTKNEP